MRIREDGESASRSREAGAAVGRRGCNGTGAVLRSTGPVREFDEGAREGLVRGDLTPARGREIAASPSVAGTYGLGVGEGVRVGK
jgi:hypothetical protein